MSQCVANASELGRIVNGVIKVIEGDKDILKEVPVASGLDGKSNQDGDSYWAFGDGTEQWILNNKKKKSYKSIYCLWFLCCYYIKFVINKMSSY